MLGAYGVSGAVVVLLLSLGAVFGGEIKKRIVEQEVVVKFVAPPKVATLDLPKPVERKLEPKVRKAAKKGPAPLGKAMTPPKEMPKEMPKEGDPTAAVGAESYVAGGREDGVVGGTGEGGASAAKVEEPEVAPSGPVVAMEPTTPPEVLDRVLPSYPPMARKNGVQAMVVVRVLVDENGRVNEARVLRGHPLLDDAVVEAVRAWRFRPAQRDGHAVAGRKLVKIPFRLRT